MNRHKRSTEYRALIPDPHDSEDQQRRFWHLDTPSPLEMKAERVLIEAAYADMVFQRVQGRYIGVGDNMLTERQWLGERLQFLAERMGKPKGRAA